MNAANTDYSDQEMEYKVERNRSFTIYTFYDSSSCEFSDPMKLRIIVYGGLMETEYYPYNDVCDRLHFMNRISHQQSRCVDYTEEEDYVHMRVFDSPYCQIELHEGGSSDSGNYVTLSSLDIKVSYADDYEPSF